MRKIVYLFSDGELSRKDDTLAFKTAEGRRFIPVEDTGEIMIYGEVNFNKRLLELLTKKEIILHYFNYYGYYAGSFYPREHLNSGYMILKQSEHYLDETKRYRIASELLAGAGKNIRQVMKYKSWQAFRGISEINRKVARRYECEQRYSCSYGSGR